MKLIFSPLLLGGQTSLITVHIKLQNLGLPVFNFSSAFSDRVAFFTVGTLPLLFYKHFFIDIY